MTEKKKLNLGPLPEEIDFSKYEETVTRWDRIVAVVLLGILFLAVPLYLLWPSAQTSEPDAGTVDPSLTVMSTVDSTSKLSVQPEEKIAEAKAEAEAEAPAPVVQSEASVQPVVEESVPEALADLGLTAPAVPAVSSTSLAVVSIQHPALSRAVLSLEMKNKEPGSALPAELLLPDSGITKVVLFTEMQGLRGQTLYHDWYRNGVRQARVKIPVNVQTQRSFSSKFINAQMTGDWQVKVVDAKSTGYVEAEFKVLAP